MTERAQCVIAPFLVVRRRSEHPEVQYKVGQVGLHRKYHYRCVIYGWDETCQQSESWKITMGVYHLPLQDRQPYYMVLEEGSGSERYVAQGNYYLFTIEGQLSLRGHGLALCFNLSLPQPLLYSFTPCRKSSDTRKRAT